MTRSYLKYILSLLVFGSNGIVASYILLSSSEIVLSRTIIGSLFLGLVFIVGGKKPHFEQIKKQWFYLLGSGFSMGLSWIFLFEAYRLTSVSTATLAYYCGPVIVIAAAPYIFREKMTINKMIGIILVVLGMVFVNGSDFLTGGMSWGLMCGIISALLYAAMIISNKKVKELDGLEITLVQLITSCMIVALYTLLMHESIISITRSSIMPILILGIVNTGVGCYLYFSSIHELPAQSVAICSYIDPLSALVFSAIILNEHLSMVQILGAILILGGAAFGESYHFRGRGALSVSQGVREE
ncbi:DMT family transporter [Desulfosporosinus meridiei]|uniref:Putative permease n=1 Tax=Desulfosporosinus meridiei (strain ATCC BAA-275 / DSM 13257 / KCTC 12902 / NCIMB 13706 / S10) TaxID=768704 RepID=J7J1I4_DESMD|nr:DMT family transporter [Desulfosporosinus meridiei]AFQ46224.1 putative permease [Desulfosporosinus meridiei DSM 13257]